MYVRWVLNSLHKTKASDQLWFGPECRAASDAKYRVWLAFKRSRRLRIAGSWYQRPELHRWTWYSNDGGVAKEIDHILVSTRWRILQNCRVYRSAEFFGTDHRLVVATLKLHVKSRRISRGCQGVYWERPRSRRGFVSTETLEKIEESRAARLAGNRDQHRALSRRTRTLLRRDKERYVRSLAEDVEGHLNANDLRPAYRALKKLRSKSPSRASAIRKADGRLVSDMDGKMAPSNTAAQGLQVECSHTPYLRGKTLVLQGEVEVLGVTYDCRLTFRAHFERLPREASGKLASLRRMSWLLDSKGFEVLYKAQVRSFMEYASLGWEAKPTSTSLSFTRGLQTNIGELINTHMIPHTSDIVAAVETFLNKSISDNFG
ncbi:Craniofacial development protein 2 [Chionoecetes opilio]|uniref:Craniofacial development protein 2 n=1 Tax=Chionoecetes opilio TaxID=41210 RepID=A0A8J4XZV2_CHIOP|nr:Craniofacial development protein 2 [Chionoecetes opilio]